MDRLLNQIFKADENLRLDQGMSVFGRHWRMLFIDGLVLIVLALISFFLAVASSIQLASSLATVFLVLGVIYLSQALELRRERGSLIRLLQSALSLVIGGFLYRYSDSGMMGITMGLTFYFLLGAVLSWVFYSDIRPHKGWNWGALSALTSFVLGFYLALMYPLAPLWLPGTLLGIELLISGSGMMGFALSVRKLQPDLILKPQKPIRDSQIRLIHNKHFHT